MNTPSAPSRAAWTTSLFWWVYAVLCFSLCLWWTFPTEAVLQRMVASLTQGSSLRVQYTEGRWTWWHGWVLRDLTIDGLPTGLTAVQLARVTVRPSLMSFFRTPPLPVTFSADLYDGTLSGSVLPRPEGIALQFALRDLRLEHFPLPAPWKRGGISGRLTADGTVQGDFADLPSLMGTLTTTLPDGAVQAGTVPRLPKLAVQAIQARLQASLRGEQVTLSEGWVNADGAEARMQGAVRLRHPLLQSELDVQLSARAAGPPSALTTLISLLPASSTIAGERAARITGVLSAPALQRED